MRWLGIGGLTALASTSAAADCIPLRIPDEVPFDGLVIPRNAELRVHGGVSEVEITLPDGEVLRLPVEDDAIGKVVAIPDRLRPLPVGEYGLSPTFFNAVEAFFAVNDTIDDVAPNAPIVAVDVETRFDGPSLWLWEECPSDPGFKTTATFSVDGTEAGDVVMVNGVVVAVATEGSTTFSMRVTSTNGPFDVQLRDLAGNESDVTTTATAGGCGGCSAVDGTVVAAVVPLALLRRRRYGRRRRPSGA